MKKQKTEQQTSNSSSTTVDEQKQKKIQTALDKIAKQFGKDALVSMSEENLEKIRAQIEVIPTGSLSLDIALGVGGLPKGRIIEVAGPESGGKTTLTLHVIAEAQKRGGVCAFIDAEHAFDPDYAKRIGVNMDTLYFNQPYNGEQGLEIATAVIESGGFDVVVIDSVAALTPKSEIDGEIGDSKMGVQARMMSQAMRKMVSGISNSKCVVIFINQLRQKIGNMYGPSEVTTGGDALKYYSTIRLDVRRGEKLGDKDNVTGNGTRVKVIKNKVAPPFKTANFDIIFGQGISKIGEIIDLGTDLDIIKKSGSWYSYDGTQLAQGKENTRELLMDNIELAEEIEQKIREAVGL